MKRKSISIVIHVLLAIAVFWAWSQMGEGQGNLSAARLASLKYFTVLSNLLQGVVSVVFVITALRNSVSHGVVILKYVAAVSVGLTFATVMLFLGPLFGYETMFVGSNFWFHLVVPVVAVLDFMLIDRTGEIAFRESLIAVIPMLLYGIYYVMNMAVGGIVGNDWYGFASGGWGMACLSFAVMLLATWGIALIVRMPRRSGKAHG